MHYSISSDFIAGSKISRQVGNSTKFYCERKKGKSITNGQRGELRSYETIEETWPCGMEV